MEMCPSPKVAGMLNRSWSSGSFCQENGDPLPAYEKGFRALNRKRPVSLPQLKKCGFGTTRQSLDRAFADDSTGQAILPRGLFENHRTR